MQRILLAIGGAAIFCAAVTFLLQIAIARGLPTTDIVLVASTATLLLSIAATAFAYRAFNRANLMASELERLTRSLDAAIKDVSLRCDREAAKLEDLTKTVTGRLDSLAARQPAEDDEDETFEKPAEKEAAASRRAKQAAPVVAPAEEPETAAVDVALRRMIAGGQADLSLQPIIAAGRGEAGGFEVHFHIQPEQGKPVDIRRLQRQVADVGAAAFERLAVVTAAEAVRRRLGDVSEKTPMHVAVSASLLQDGLEFATVLDIFKLHPALARSIVMSVPADLLASGEFRQSLEQLTGQGLRLAVEDWDGSADSLASLREAKVEVVKIAAERLLDRGKGRKAAPGGTALTEAVREAGMDVVATEVASEEDAVALIEMGVDLMTGEKLSAPRRLKAEAGIARRR